MVKNSKINKTSSQKHKLYELYYADAMPKNKIAKTLKTNLETINSDINSIQTEIGNEFTKKDRFNLLKRNLEFLENERHKLVKLLEFGDSICSLKVHKMIIEISEKIYRNVSEMTVNSSEQKFTEVHVNAIIRQICLCSEESLDSSISQESLQKEIFLVTLEEERVVKEIFNSLIDRGLKFFENPSGRYNLLEFARILKIISKEEKEEIEKKYLKEGEEELEREDEIKAKYMKKFGSDDSKWSHYQWRTVLDEIDGE